MTGTLGAVVRPAVGRQAPRRRGAHVDTDPPLRLRLTADDLARLTVLPGGGPFTESILSLRLLSAPQPNPLVATWVRQTRTMLEAANLPLTPLLLMEQLVDLHLGALQTSSIGGGLRQLTTGPAHWVGPSPATTEAGLDRAAASLPTSLQAWLQDLRNGDGRAVDAVARLFLAYHRRAVQPHWRAVHASLVAEQSRCGRLVTEGGLDRMLATLHPKLRWRSPVLDVCGQVEGAPPDRGVPARDHGYERRPVQDLGGRSLALVPSMFGVSHPRVLWGCRHPTLPVVVVYPALRSRDEATALWGGAGAPDRSALARLLGRTQAAVLEAIADTCTTSELAQRVGVSPSTASHHAGILRGAGLVTTRRSQTSVVHRLTALGLELLGRDEAGPA